MGDYEDKLPQLLQSFNVEFDTRLIKAWFDTNCRDLLEWLCDSITEKCYVPPHEENEFFQLQKVFNDEELNQKVSEVQKIYTDLFEVEDNLMDIEVSTDIIKSLEDNLTHLKHEMEFNTHLNNNLHKELEEVTRDEFHSELELDVAQEHCVKLSQELDNVNLELHQQLLKYKQYLENFEYSHIPLFINKVDIEETEDKVTVATNLLNNALQIDPDIINYESIFSDTLFDFEYRLFTSLMKSLAPQIEVSGLCAVLKFLQNVDFNSSLKTDCDSLLQSIENSKAEQDWMIKIIEANCQQSAKSSTNEITLRFLKNELQSQQATINSLSNLDTTLTRILTHAILLHNLCFQEKVDIISSYKFFKILKEITWNLQDSTHRQDEMNKIIENFQSHCLLPIEKRFPFLEHFSRIILNKDNLKIDEIGAHASVLRAKIKFSKKDTFAKDVKLLQQLKQNKKILCNFLISEASSKMVYLPSRISLLLLELDKNLEQQKYHIKLALQMSAQSQEKRANNIWLRRRRALWSYFMTNPKKMIAFLEKIKLECTDKNNFSLIKDA